MNKEKISQIIHHPTTKLVAVGVVGFCGGLIVGAVLDRAGKKSALSKEDQDELDRISHEVDELRAKRAKRMSEAEVGWHPSEGPPDSVVVVDQVTEVEQSETVLKRNVFAENEATEDDVWDYEAEMRTRDSEEPYVLHKDEFYADEMDFHQRTYTYFDGDDIMADEDERPVYNYSQIVGELKFGHGSGDPKVVYIRNEKRKEEYEIVKDPGLFSIEVAGLEIEDNQRVKGRIVEHSTAKRYPLKRFPLKE